MSKALFRSNIRALGIIEANLSIPFDHNKQIILSAKNQERLRIARNYLAKAFVKLIDIE